MNLTSTILSRWGVSSNFGKLQISELNNINEYDHIILMVFDGLGYDFLTNNIKPVSIFNSGTVQKLSTVFPPTTSAALTSIYSAESPSQHGYIGWTLHFKEFNCYYNLLPGLSALSKERWKGDPEEIYKLMPINTIYNKLSKSNDPPIMTHITEKCYLGSKYTTMTSNGAKVVGYRKWKDMVRTTAAAIRKAGDSSSFTTVYCSKPDKDLHSAGIDGDYLNHFVDLLSCQIRKLTERLRRSKALILLTADHGMTPVKKYIDLHEIPELWNLLEKKPYIESRCTTFFVIKGKENEFKKIFEEQFQDQFKLLDKNQFFESGLLGPEPLHIKVEDFIGTYVAIAINEWGIKGDPDAKKKRGRFKSHHAGGTPQERDIPLFIWSSF